MTVPKRVFVLVLHTDDAGLGAGGSITRWLEAGVDLHVVMFSTAGESLSDGSALIRLTDERHAPLGVLGMKPENRQIMHYLVRKLGHHRQEVLENMVAMERQLDLKWILIPSGADLYWNHATIHNRAMRAFKHKTLLGYEPLWNHITFPVSVFVTLDKRYLDKKWDALAEYTSQLEMGRVYFTKEFHESLAKVRGLQVKHDWAETFELIRVIL